ncbi:MAG: AmmeMemoRadiSam system protein B [Acidimicrobiales bacterium]
MNVRPAAVAGRFYPALAEDLIETLTEFIGAQTPGRVPKALIVPHAGYRYSGALAGRACSLDLGEVERVVMFGPNHTAPLHGAAVPSHDYWRTPIGDVKVDTAEVRRLAERLDTAVDDEPHRSEHCLEVQIPFLQRVLGSEFKILPVLVGEMSLEASASLVRDCWGAPGTVVLVSTDLSHYLPYEQAQRMDQVTAETISLGAG